MKQFVRLAEGTSSKAERPAAPAQRASIGGMPFGLPLALLQMEADPGCLTNLPRPSAMAQEPLEDTSEAPSWSSQQQVCDAFTESRP